MNVDLTLTVDGYRKIKTTRVKAYYVRLAAIGYGARYLNRPHKTASEAIAYGNRAIKRYEKMLQAMRIPGKP